MGLKREFWTEHHVTDGRFMEGLTPILEYSTIIAFLVVYTGTLEF